MGAGARWSKTKEDLAGEPRFQAVPRADREALFREYVAEQDVRRCGAGPCLSRVWYTQQAGNAWGTVACHKGIPESMLRQEGVARR